MDWFNTTTRGASEQPRNNVAVRQGFRSDIEGLRGICVGAVVLFHVFPSWLPGGFIGVDIFFVISGYLITQLLLREIERTGGINFLDFWGRRIRRILPAATAVLVGIALAALLVPAIDGRLLGRHIVAAALFYYNWRQASEGLDYLAEETRDVALLHYWSLSVEEQFYLVWPLVLAALAVWGLRSTEHRVSDFVMRVTLVLAAASFGFSVYSTFFGGPAAFFNTFSRAWQLLCGAFVAAALLHGGPQGRFRAWAGALSVVCLAVLCASFVFISKSLAYPGYVAAVPTLAAAILIYVGSVGSGDGVNQTGGSAAALLRLPALRFVGLVSFSLYLWHWPVLVVARYSGFDGLLASWVVIGVSFCLAVASYYLIEVPVRYDRRLVASHLMTYLFGAGLILTGVAAGLAMKAWAPDDVHLGGGMYSSVAVIKTDRPAIYGDKCMLAPHEVAYAPCVYGDLRGARTVVLFGDSHAGNWFSGLNRVAVQNGWRLFVRVKAACSPNEAQQVRDGRIYRECATWRERVLAEIAMLKPDLVVVAAQSDALPVEGERAVLARLGQLASTVIIRDTPKFDQAPVDCLRQRSNPETCVWRLADVLPAGVFPKTPVGMLPSNVRILDLNDRICPRGVCPAVIDGRVVMRDTHHLSSSFSATLGDAFSQLIEGK